MEQQTLENFGEIPILHKNKFKKMTTATQIELSEPQKAAVEAGKNIAIPASWEEFIDFLPTTHYKAEFVNSEIIIMGLAKLIHEWLVGQIIWILKNMYHNSLNTLVMSSNLGVLNLESSFFNPDVTVVKGKPIFYKNSEAIITNPYLVVEILSEGTASYDWESKLPRYQQIESIQEIVIVHPVQKSITVLSRTTEKKVWMMTIYDQPTETVFF